MGASNTEAMITENASEGFEEVATTNPSPTGPGNQSPPGEMGGAEAGLAEDDAGYAGYARGTGGEESPQAMEGAAGEAPGGARRRVLIVDDEPDFTFMMGLTLEQTGQYEVRQENDPIQALDTAREFSPDLILLDVMMPDMDGGDVLNQLRADASGRNVPVIFLTALVGGDEAPGKGLPSGGHSFLPKPVNLPVLLQRMDQLLGDG